MAKKNSGKNYSGKSYTSNNTKKSKSGYQGAVKKSERVEEAPSKKQRFLTDTSGVDGYFRPENSVGRWRLGYEIFMGSFMKMIGLNFIMLLSLVPLFILLFNRWTTIYAEAYSSPFSANMGVGYFPFASVLGLEESILYSANYNFFTWLPLASLLVGVGLSGGMYVMRNLCWGEDVPVMQTFVKGVKKNILPIIASVAIYSVVLSLSCIGISKINLTVAVDGGKWYFTLIKVLLYVLIGFSTLQFMAMTSISVTYTGSFFTQMKNCLIFTISLLPLNLFFAVFALLPFVFLFFGTDMLSLSLILIMFLGASFTMLVWTLYSQWIYAKFVQGKVQSYEATEEEIQKRADREKSKEVAKQEDGYREVGKTKSIMDDVTPVTDYDVAIDDLEEVFSRDEIEKVTQSKKRLD